MADDTLTDEQWSVDYGRPFVIELADGTWLNMRSEGGIERAVREHNRVAAELTARRAAAAAPTDERVAELIDERDATRTQLDTISRRERATETQLQTSRWLFDSAVRRARTAEAHAAELTIERDTAAARAAQLENALHELIDAAGPT